ncbi:MAG: polyphosphate kinase 1 [Fuerstiella sp.]|nr:polyphosphate kinase 1 [Fuerstiella sp.]
MSKMFVNRELSWLEFNQRVLDEGRDTKVPLLERLRFLAITASNLDEFFMVRIGGLKTAIRQNSESTGPEGMTPAEQLSAATARVHSMMADLYEFFLNELDPQLTKVGIRRRHSTELTEDQTAYVEGIFDEQISSVLTPIAIHDPSRFPLLQGHTVNIAVQLAPEEGQDDFRFAVIPFGKSDLRFITLPSDGGFEFILAEDLIELFIQRFFPGEDVISTVAFRITRNADMSVREDDGSDLLAEMEDILDERKESFCVRLELSDQVTSPLQSFLKSLLRISDSDVYVVPGPTGFSDFMRLADLNGFSDYRYPRWTPKDSPRMEPGASIFDVIRAGDVLLVHPYESFDPVVRLVNESADDPDVLAIKQTLYRTSRNSPIIEGLMRAAESGKNVTAIVELKARFDEARNIEWARRMEYAGIQVIYGVRGLKTHAKACIVVRREPQGFVRYVHFGTGNYNEITARLYTDLSYMTCQEDLGSDAVSWFNAVTGYSQLQELRRLVSAPVGLREKILEMISLETEHARNGGEARIVAKCNSLADPEIIQALYDAAQAGVNIQLNVRGICCLMPQVPGLSDRIHVTSIVDRFLEHSRIFYFYHGGDRLVFISSADLMPRNLDRRVELLIPILDEDCKQRVIELLELCLDDNVKVRRILPNGGYETVSTTFPTVRSQEECQRLATKAEEQAVKRKRMMFTPQSPQ